MHSDLLVVVLDQQAELHLLVDLPAHLHLHCIILLELHAGLAQQDLHAVALEIGGATLPGDVLGEVVAGDEDGGAAEAEAEDVTLGGDALAAGVEEEVEEALDHELLKTFAPRPRPVDEPDLPLQPHHLVVLQLLPRQAFLQLLVYHQVREPPHRGGEVRVALQAQSEVPLVGVQVPRVHRELLDLHRLEQQQLLQPLVDRLLLEQQLELVLQPSQVPRLELHPQLREVVVEVGQVVVQRLRVVDQQRVHPEVTHQLPRHLAVRQDHELLHQFLRVDPLLESDVGRHALLVELEHNLALVEHLAVAPSLPPVEGNRPQGQQLLLQLRELLGRHPLLHLQPPLLCLRVDDGLSLLVAQLRSAPHHRLLKAGGGDSADEVDAEEGAEGKPALVGLESELLDEARRHHVDGLVRQVHRGALPRDLLPVEQVLVGGHVGNVHSQLVDPVAQGFQRQPVLHVHRVERVDRENHPFELSMPLYRQVVLSAREVFRVQQSTLFLGNIQAVQQNIALDLGCLVLPAEGGDDAALGRALLVVPVAELSPEISFLILAEHLWLREILLLNFRGGDDVEGGQLLIDGESLDPVVLAVLLYAKGAEELLAVAEVLAVADAHHHCADHFSAALPLGQVLPPHFRPVDLRSVDNLEAVGVVDFDSLGEVGALDDSRVVLVSRLHEVYSLVEVVILLHCYLQCLF